MGQVRAYYLGGARGQVVGEDPLMRMTQNKRAVLAQLPLTDDADLRHVAEIASCADGEPLSASAVASRLDKRMTDVARTLRHLEAQGFAVSEIREHCVTRRKFGSSVRKLKCYRLAPGVEPPF